MFKTILIANRGEIACRIIRTCRRLGIRSVAVYSDADAGARHVRMADEAVHVGAAAARESYLVMERILDAARQTGAEAIHPGYGFLSENADFARQVREAGLTLIGPSPETMILMGSKAAAKAKMEPAGVPLIPGYHGDDQSDVTLMAEAERVGFPLMLKAAAGGGGKGMRVVRSAEDFAEALAAARREASGAFGDERMILERYLERPRHIEAQIFADTKGNTVHLFERDCSSQRRHQKIIEEAPAAGLSETLRAELLAAAVRAAEAVDYVGAGTVEFLVDGNEFFFLEMNTRLQVEHPVTECITDQDLVEWQLRVAAGEPLPLRQDELRIQGHAMEARLYAEDPDQGFVPSTGRIRRLHFPTGDSVRVDTGVEQGDEVSMHYDPMIAKLIVHGPDREAARQRLLGALANTFVAGPTTNLGFLQALAASKAFAEASIDTGQLDRDLPSIIPATDVSDQHLALAAALWALDADERTSQGSPWDRPDGWRLGEPGARSFDLEVGPRREIVQLTGFGGDYRANVGDQVINIQLRALGEGQFQAGFEDRRERLTAFGDGAQRLDFSLRGQRFRITRHERFEATGESQAGEGRLTAPMPGKILEVRAQAGATVTEGETLLIMEAMKMELTIKAPFDGEVAEIAVAADDVVEADALLLEMSAGD
ncbi:acetyl/propionyl/methylcrotonyl-CoA carboxylase subunit alpha [Wenzhouxiangella marina]|uniref:Biotin carboxylase n=1 Tax=Wenzhouxiangella marina TaxID=1579979 RepID=A0A0K0XUS8_9GAMM|nr:biotin carboxylase N-terminal domain-containing protein [Wenzhouxiangella marina]AKS41464.1 3-methylcrotonyl-CoA carboxylase [Wenzhouxiangella marina]MBB6086779.1 3-methylcrotonyl-CoA carboxylase alpha subunit [Wenzhouxiangella marina]